MHQQALQKADVAENDIQGLIEGETGTGKEMAVFTDSMPDFHHIGVYTPCLFETGSKQALNSDGTIF